MIGTSSSGPRQDGGLAFPAPATLAVPTVLLLGALLPSVALFQALATVGLIVAVATIGTCLANWAVPTIAGASRTTAAAAFGLATPIALGTLLGAIGWLRAPIFLCAVAGLFVAASKFRRKPRQRTLRPGLHTNRSRLDAEGLARSLVVTALGALVIWGLVTIHARRYAAPGFFGLDDTSYQMTQVAVWNQSGDLRQPKLPFGDPSTPYYPFNAALVTWALLTPLQGSDLLARWAQLPFSLASLWAIAAIAARLGAGRLGRMVAVLAFAAIERPFHALALSAGNDHAMAFFVLAGIDSLLILSRRRSHGAALYTGLCLGLAAGTKYAALVFAGLPFLVAIGLVLRRNRRNRRNRRHSRLAVLLGSAGLSGGFAYLRNLWTTGNPLFPSPLSIGPWRLSDGLPSASLSHRLDAPEAAIALPQYFFRPDLFGSFAPWWLLGGALLAPLVVLATHRDLRPRSNLPAFLITLTPSLAFVLFLRFTPDHRDLRYLLAGLALACIGLGLSVGRLTARRLARMSRPAGVGISALIAVTVLIDVAGRFRDPDRGLWAIIVALLASAIGHLVLRKRETGFDLRPRRTGRWLIAGLAVIFLAEVEPRYRAEKFRHRWAARTLDQFVGAEGAAVAYAGFNQPYLLAGSRLQNRLEMVPTRCDTADRFVTWRPSPAECFGPAPYRDWRDRIDRLEIDYVVLVRYLDKAPVEARFLRQHPRRFQRLAVEPRPSGELHHEIWRVLPGQRSIPDPQPPEAQSPSR